MASDSLREYGAAVRQFSRNARLYLWVALLSGFTVGVTRVLYNLYIQALGYDEAFIGQLLAVTAVAAGLTALPAGILTDRWGTKRALIVGSLGVGIGSLGQMLLTGPWQLQISGAVAGAGGAVALAAQAPFLARHSTERERTYLFSTMVALFLASTIIGNLLSGRIPLWLRGLSPLLSQAWAYRGALLLGGAASALSLPLLFLIREDDEPGRERRWMLSRRSGGALAKLMTADGLIGLGAGLTIPFLNVFFVNHLGATAALYGTMSALALGLRVVATLVAPVVAGRLGPVLTIALTQLASVPLLLLLGYAPGLAVAMVAFVTRTTLMNMTVPVHDSFAMTVVDASSRATVTAALLVTNNLVFAASTWIGGRLIVVLGYQTPFIFTAALYVASALAFVLLFGPQAGRRSVEEAAKES